MRKLTGVAALLVLVAGIAGGCQRREPATSTETSASTTPAGGTMDTTPSIVTTPSGGMSTSTSSAAPLETAPTRVP